MVLWIAAGARVAALAVLVCAPLPKAEALTAADVSPLPGLPARTASIDAQPALVALGRQLFFDEHLSRDGSISCASCHVPDKAYTDGKPVAIGVAGAIGTRNVPSLLNVASRDSLFWDGRRQTLEMQASDPFLNPREHGLVDMAELLQAIRSTTAYEQPVQLALGISPSALQSTEVVAALAAFERTLLAGDSAFDRFYYRHQTTALSAAAQRGLTLFANRARCVTCHSIGPEGATFSDGQFHGAGIGIKAIEAKLGALAAQVASADEREIDRMIVANPDIAALGRFAVTKRPIDIGHYRTPSLRNVALTAPYMHDGSVATLDEAVERELYYRSGELSRPLVLTDSEKADLKAFLEALTSDDWPQ